MIRWNGIGEFAEDFIKQAHQFGVKEEIRTRGMFSKTKAAMAQMHWEWKKQTTAVIKANARVKKETGRKRKRAAVEKENEAKVSRDAKRLASLQKIKSGVYEMMPNYENERIPNEYEGELSSGSSGVEDQQK